MRIFTAIALVCIGANAQAQFVTNGNNINNTNSGNVGIGTTTPTAKLDVVGSINISSGSGVLVNGLRQIHTTGTENNFFGQSSGNAITTGSGNAFFGHQSGQQNTTGNNNLFVGYKTGNSNTTGKNNTLLGNKAGLVSNADGCVFIGHQSGMSNTTGVNNMFIGPNAGLGNTTGRYNVAIGSSALGASNNSDFSIAIGYNAGLLSTATRNTFVGDRAGKTITSGANNTFLGANADGTPTVTGSTAIGYNAIVTQDNSVVIGSSITNMGVGVSAPTQKLHVAGNARITGSIYDKNNEAGIAGQVLSSTGNGIDWIASPVGLPAAVEGQTLINSAGTWSPNNNLFNNGVNVGIGNTAPTAKLHVTGSARITGSVYDGYNQPGFSGQVLMSEGGLTKWESVCTVLADCDGAGIGGWGTDSVSVNNTNGESSYLNNAFSSVSNMGAGALVFSSKGVGYSPDDAGSATRMTYMPTMAAFRAGHDSQGVWNPENQGYGSSAFGENTVASGRYSVASGLLSQAEGFGSVAFGQNTRANGYYASSFGYENQVNGNGSLAAGLNNIVDGYASVAFGQENYSYGAFSLTNGSGNSALTYAETVLGSFATMQEGASDQFSINDRLFALGNGSTAASRSNAMVVMKNGRVGIGSNSPTGLLQVNGKTTSDETVGEFRVNYSNEIDVVALKSYSITAPGYGYGFQATGGYYGAYIDNQGGTYGGGAYGVSASSYGSSGYRIGVYAVAQNPGGSAAYGVFASASGSASPYAGYFSGSVYTTGTYQASDQRLKHNISDLKEALPVLNKLKVHQYEYQTDKYPTMHLEEGVRYGFMADEIKQVFPGLVKLTYQPLNSPQDAQGNRQEVEYLQFDAVNYTELIPVIVKSIQELSANQKHNVDQLASKAELAEAKAEIDELKALVKELLANQAKFDGDLQQCCFEHSNQNGSLENGTSINNGSTAFESGVLDQNQPNPFQENTTIKYYLPNGTRSASITISNLNGVRLKNFDLSGTRGAGQVLISGGSFPAGTYLYTLTVNGKQLDTKTMVLM